LIARANRSGLFPLQLITVPAEAGLGAAASVALVTPPSGSPENRSAELLAAATEQRLQPETSPLLGLSGRRRTKLVDAAFGAINAARNADAADTKLLSALAHILPNAPYREQDAGRDWYHARSTSSDDHIWSEETVTDLIGNAIKKARRLTNSVWSSRSAVKT
jgi:hypothetical protein